jgi:hypothetical protein
MVEWSGRVREKKGQGRQKHETLADGSNIDEERLRSGSTTLEEK